MKSIQEILREELPKVFKEDRIYLSPNISEKTLDNALDKFEYTGGYENIVGIYDLTFFRDGKEGIIFTGTQLIYKLNNMLPVPIKYTEISKARYAVEVLRRKNGEVENTDKLVISFKSRRPAVELYELQGCSYIKFASMLNKLKANEISIKESNVFLTLEDMNKEVKDTYIKIVINSIAGSKDFINAHDYIILYTLIKKLNMTEEQRLSLRNYMGIGDKHFIDVKEDTERLLARLKNAIPQGHEKSVYMSLLKDIVYIYEKKGIDPLTANYISVIRTRLGIGEGDLKLILESLGQESVNDRLKYNHRILELIVKDVRYMGEIVNKLIFKGNNIESVSKLGSTLEILTESMDIILKVEREYECQKIYKKLPERLDIDKLGLSTELVTRQEYYDKVLEKYIQLDIDTNDDIQYVLRKDLSLEESEELYSVLNKIGYFGIDTAAKSTVRKTAKLLGSIFDMD